MGYEVVETDVLVIGAGGAGCRAAIEAVKSNLDVLVVSKEILGKAHTCMAEGGYNAALANVDARDDWRWHFFDTVKGGAWINNQVLVEHLVRESADALYDLEEFGAVFDRTAEGKINQRAFGKASRDRTCFAGDRTGHEMMATLVEELRRTGVAFRDEVFMSRLLVRDGAVVGATGLDLVRGDLFAVKARSTVLASGGAGRIYEVTTNAQGDTGDGFAMGFHAGAELVDMEMVQFHPTGMIYPESCLGVLVTEAVRAEGGRLFNKQGERFMQRYNPKEMELAGRDEVARSIATEILEGRGTERGGVYLDVSHLPPEVIEFRLPSMLEQFLKVGVDIRKEPMDVAPTTHHFMGGLIIDEEGQTALKSLFAAGEVTGGVHGGNRLGGNALADTQVFGKRAGAAAAAHAKKVASPFLPRDSVEEDFDRINSQLDRREGVPASSVRKRLQSMMWNRVGIFRTEERMQEALKAILEWKKLVPNGLSVRERSRSYNKEWLEALEIPNMLLVAEMVTRGAVMRKESRGAHFRRDYPKPDDVNWFRNITYRVGEGGSVELGTRPITTRYIPKSGMDFNAINWPA